MNKEDEIILMYEVFVPDKKTKSLAKTGYASYLETYWNSWWESNLSENLSVKSEVIPKDKKAFISKPSSNWLNVSYDGSAL